MNCGINGNEVSSSFIMFEWRLIKASVTALLPLLIAIWIGGVISNFNVLMVVHWNGQPFNHCSSGRVISDFNVLMVVHWNRRRFNHYLSPIISSIKCKMNMN